MDRVAQVADVIDFITRCHPQGLKVLLGEVEPPSSEELVCILESFEGPTGEDIGRVDSSPKGHGPQEGIVLKADQIEQILNYAGGWPQIVSAAQEYQVAFPQSWMIFRDYILWVDSIRDHSRLRESQLFRIARKHRVSEDTVQRRRQEVPWAIARTAILAPVETWSLMGDTAVVKG